MAPSKFQRRVMAERAAVRDGERISEFFEKGKGMLPVRRYELLAILTQLERGREGRRWRSRIWRWLQGKVGSGPISAAVEPKKPETE